MKPLLLVFLLMPALIRAQTPIQFRLGYFGPTITTPGVRASADYALFAHNRQVMKRGDTLTKTHQWLVSGSAGYYSRVSLQQALFVIPQTGYQHTGKRGFTKTVLAGVGWLRLMTPKTAYTDGKGNTLRVSVPAESVAMYAVETALGWTYRPKQSRHWGWSLRPSAFWYKDRAGGSSGNLTVSIDLHVQLHKP